MRKIILPLAILILFLSPTTFAQQKNYKSTFRDINSFNKTNSSSKDEAVLKAHLISGGICIYSDTAWFYDEATDLINGNGSIYDIQRNLVRTGIIEMKVDSIVLFESNRKLDMKKRQGRMAARSIITVLDGTLGVICLTVPKACWGSCPTFYTGEGDYVFNADAEGFSEAILPSMEYGDIDALYNFNPEGKDFSIIMKNEAHETLVVRKFSILALERDPSLKVFHGADDQFYLTNPHRSNELISALGDEGDITQKLLKPDLEERFSPADSKNMKSKEEIFLKFKRENLSEAGLVLNFRQSLMTTYLIYSVMGYMGNTVSDFFAELEKNNRVLKKHKLIDEELGGVDVYLLNNGEYRYCGVYNETGPIASNQQLLPLGELPTDEEVTIKLVLNKGLWRLDYASLLPVLGKANVVELKPERLLYKKEVNPELLESLNDESKQLISMPGDEFELQFTLPECQNDFDLFLYSKGYYLEWMRESWLDDKNLLKLNLLLENPDKFFKKEARKYSKYEKEIEEIFWSSRIDTKTYNQNE